MFFEPLRQLSFTRRTATGLNSVEYSDIIFGIGEHLLSKSTSSIKVSTKPGQVPCSNGGFAVPLPGENILCFLYGLQQVFEMSGGVPRKMRFDNLSAAVISIGKKGQRVLCEQFQRFMLHYRFEAEFCNPGKGNEKGCTENKVGSTPLQLVSALPGSRRLRITDIRTPPAGDGRLTAAPLRQRNPDG